MLNATQPASAGETRTVIVEIGGTQQTPSTTPTPSATSRGFKSPTPTATVTDTPKPSKTPTVVFTDTATPTRTPTPLPGANQPVALIATGDNDILNILLVGSDQRPDDGSYRTDTMVVVSVNRTASTVSLLSIPRDWPLCWRQFQFSDRFRPPLRTRHRPFDNRSNTPVRPDRPC